MEKSNLELQKIINFFKLEGEYDKNEAIDKILSKMSGITCETRESGFIWCDGELMSLYDFVKELYEIVIESVCDVIKNFQK